MPSTCHVRPAVSCELNADGFIKVDVQAVVSVERDVLDVLVAVHVDFAPGLTGVSAVGERYIVETKQRTYEVAENRVDDVRYVLSLIHI